MDHDARSPGFQRLSDDAQRILARLLTAPFPGRDEIARQVAIARARVIDEHGCLELSATDAPRAEVVRRIPVEAEAEDVDGMTFHVLLHVLEGYVDELEIYRDDSLPLMGSIDEKKLRVMVL